MGCRRQLNLYRGYRLPFGIHVTCTAKATINPPAVCFSQENDAPGLILYIGRLQPDTASQSRSEDSTALENLPNDREVEKDSLDGEFQYQSYCDSSLTLRKQPDLEVTMPKSLTLPKQLTESTPFRTPHVCRRNQSSQNKHHLESPVAQALASQPRSSQTAPKSQPKVDNLLVVS